MRPLSRTIISLMIALSVMFVPPPSTTSLQASSSTQVYTWGNDQFKQTTLTPTVYSGYTHIFGSQYAQHFFAKKADGTIDSWGDNTYQQRDIPTEISTRDISKLIPGSSYTLAIMNDKTVVGWGDDHFDELNIPSDLSNVRDVKTTLYSALALKYDGTLVMWTTPYTDPNFAIPDGLNDVVAISAGGEHFVALKSDKTVVAWGVRRNNLLEVPDILKDVVAISASATYTLALKEDGTVVGWGDSTYGTLDIPADLTNVVEISAAWDFAVARKADGTLVAWGRGINQQLAFYTNSTNVTEFIITSHMNMYQTVVLQSDGTLKFSIFKPIPQSLSGITTVAAGGYYSLAIQSDKTVIGWGRNDYGQVNIPTDLTNVIDIDAGYSHSLALVAKNNTVVAWGDNTFGQTTVPANLDKVVAISAGKTHSMALKANGTVVAWGDNSYGQTRIPKNLTNVIAISAGCDHSLALKSNGTVVSWGGNKFTYSAVPANLTNVVAIAAGCMYSLALKANGTVVTWGVNSISPPANLTNVVAITAGAGHAIALKSDGNIVTWGSNEEGQANIPTNLRNVVAIAAGINHTIVLTGSQRVTRPTLPSTTQTVRNPSFESGTEAWVQFKTGPSALIQHIPVRAKQGRWLAILGGLPNENMSITQMINVPKNKTTLTFFYQITSREQCGFFYDTARIIIVGSREIWKIDACNYQVSNRWTMVSLNLKPYANQRVYLEFNMRTNGSNNSAWFIDDMNWR